VSALPDWSPPESLSILPDRSTPELGVSVPPEDQRK
jgi:hypothetical protein